MGKKGQGKARKRNFTLRDTGIFRDRVPGDENDLVLEVLGKDADGFVGRTAPRPGTVGPAADFLAVCKEHRRRALLRLKKFGMHRLPWQEFDGCWLQLPEEVTEAWRLVLAVDYLVEQLNEPPWCGRIESLGESYLTKERVPTTPGLTSGGEWFSLLGRQLLAASAAAKVAERAPADEAEKLSREVGEFQVLELLGEALRIGRLIERCHVRGEHEARAVLGRKVGEPLDNINKKRKEKRRLLLKKWGKGARPLAEAIAKRVKDADCGVVKAKNDLASKAEISRRQIDRVLSAAKLKISRDGNVKKTQ